MNYSNINLMPTIKKYSAGTFLTRYNLETKLTEVLLIKKEWSETNVAWVGPKGGIEEGESIESAAIRETQEETGVKNISLIKQLQDHKYKFEKDGNIIDKTVHQFWAATDFQKDQVLIKGTTESEKKTQTDTKWFELREALEIVRDENDKQCISEIISTIYN